jgi:hypothetical protein
MNPSRKSATKVGIAAVAAAAFGCLSLPLLMELCTVGAISGPMFLLAVLALAALLGAGALLLLARKANGSLFVVSSGLFLLCFLGETSVMRTIPLELAALGSLGGTVFSLWRWRQPGLT